jgi:hypothetical protein
VVGETYGDLNGRRHEGGRGPDAFVVTLDSRGQKKWTRLIGSRGDDEAEDVTTDGRGRIYVAGTIGYEMAGKPYYGGEDGFVAAFDPDGTRQWLKIFGTPKQEKVRAVMTDGQGRIYIVGDTQGDLGGNNRGTSPNVFVMAFDSTGTRQWTELFGTSDAQTARDAHTDGQGDIHITGYTYGDLGGGTRYEGQEDGFVATFDRTGTRQHVTIFGTPGRERAKAVATDDQGHLYVAGETRNSMDGQPYIGGRSDVFLKRLR